MPKKIFAALLAFLLICSLLPFSVLADEPGTKSEHRRALEGNDFFEYWEEEELISQFEADSAGISVEAVYPGGNEELSEAVECEFVDGILEIVIHNLTPEQLKKVYGVGTKNNGKLSIGFKISLPDDIDRSEMIQGNGPIFKTIRDSLDSTSDLTSNDKEYLFRIDLGRFVRDGEVITFFPEKDSMLRYCFLGYYKGETVCNRVLVAWISAASDAKSVSFVDPNPITDVDISQIEVDDTYAEKLAGEGNDGIFYENGQLTYKYLGGKVTPQEIAADLSIPDNGPAETCTLINAPEGGYTLYRVYDENGEEYAAGSDPSKAEVGCFFGKNGNILNKNTHYVFVWQKEEDLLYQEIYITNDFGKSFVPYAEYWDAPNMDHIQLYSDKLGNVTAEQLAGYGINVAIDLECGSVFTTFNGAKLDEVGECVAKILPPENAAYFKAQNWTSGVNSIQNYDIEQVKDMKKWLDDGSLMEIGSLDGWNFPVVVSETVEIDDFTIWYTSTISAEQFVIEWYDESKKFIEGNYLYGSQGDLSVVRETEAINEDQIDGTVLYPTVIKANGESDKGTFRLQSKKNPQNGESEMLIELRALWEDDPSEMKRIFIPREYIDYEGDWNENNIKIKVTHFEGCDSLDELEDAAKTGKGADAFCQFTENGLIIYTNSFSPFMIEWDDAEPEKRRHSGDTVVIGRRDNKEEKYENEGNPNTGAPVSDFGMPFAVVGIMCLVLLGKKKS